MNEELIEFKKEMIDDIRNDAVINYSDPTDEFINYYIDKLNTAEELLEFEEYDIEILGKNRRKAKVDGYCYDKLERSISLFIVDFSNEYGLSTLTNTQIDILKSRVINYLDLIFNNYIFDYIEESSLGYQLAKQIDEYEKHKLISKINIYILSDSILSTYVKNISSDNYLNKKIELIIWDISRIYNLIKSSLKKEDLNIDLSKYDNSNVYCIKAIENKQYCSYLAVIDGQLLADLYIDYGPRLLEGNVRSFLSVRGKVNKGIRATIRKRPDNFFVFNNGIACTATDATFENTDNGLLLRKLTNFQIINGGQTTASIANAILQGTSEEKANVKKVNVSMKLTVIKKEAYIDNTILEFREDMTEEEKKDAYVNQLTADIAKYANSQNKVDESDFFSNHPYHIRIESLSRKNYAPPKDGNPYETIWFYERAKGQYTQAQMKLTKTEKKKFSRKYPKNQVIKKIDLAKYLMTWNKLPYIVSKGNQYNMRCFADGIKVEWNENKDHSNFNNYYFKKCISLAILFKSTEQLVSHSEWYQDVKAYRANVVEYTISSISYMIEKNYKNMELNYLKIWNSQSLYYELEKQINDLTPKVYDFITSPERVTQNVTEWCKKKLCWEQAEILMDNEVWELNNDFVKTLVSKDKSSEQMKKERKEQREDDGIQNQTKVINYSDLYWKRALAWGIDLKIIDEVEMSFLKSATNFQKHIPSEKQCKKILEINQRLIDEGFK